MPINNQKMKTLARSIKADPSDSFSKFALALEFLKKEELERAKLLFEDVYEKEPEYVGVYYHLGKLYERLAMTEKAKNIYREGIEIAKQQKENRTHKELKEALAELKIETEGE